MAERVWTAAEAGRAIGDGSLDPVEEAERLLEAIAAAPEGPRIYARLSPVRARDEAIAARTRAKAGLRLGPLDGVSLSWKDLFDSAGLATEGGSKLLEGRVPETDAKVLAAATAQGTVCLGKTHMTELAFSGLGINPSTATSPNVNDPALAPGGSSSGAAASVAFGLAHAAIGSDTGGSVRLPSAWNDLVGLKTTAGRISLQGVIPLGASFDTIGPLARSVEDCALLLALLEAGKPADLAEASLSGLNLLVLEGLPFDGARTEPVEGFESAVDRLAAAGARITRRALPMVDEAVSVGGLLLSAEAYGTWRAVIEAAPSKMYPRILERFRTGANILAADFVTGWQRLDILRAEWLAATAGYDAVLLPSSPILPPDAERLVSDPAYFTAENLLALRNTRIGNALGLCAITLPTGVPSTGISLMGRPFAEERLLRVAAAAERALG